MASHLGTKLRHLLDLLEADLQGIYQEAGLKDFRPRFSPVVQAMEALGPCSIKDIAGWIGISHSAASQTLSMMVRCKWVRLAAGRDGREKLVVATPALKKLMPTLRRLWAATDAGAADLQSAMGIDLEKAVADAIQALAHRPFHERIQHQLRQEDP